MTDPSVALAVRSAEPLVTDRALVAIVAVALALASVHLFPPGVVVAEALPRPAVLSLGSGVSVAYVFVHLLPEVAAAESAVVHGDAAVFPLDLPVYLLALGGFLTFYGLEHHVRRARETTDSEAERPGGVFWIHVAFFGCYNAVLGYLLVEEGSKGTLALVLFGVAVGLHLLVNDYSLREHHGDRYHRYGRWVLAAAVSLGTLIGTFLHVSHVLLGGLVAFLAGAIVLNAVKEELPDERDSEFGAFASGALCYTALLLAV